MATRIEAFRSDAGKVFDTEHEALKDDFRVALGEAIQNDPIATSAVRQFTDDRERLEQLATLFRQLLNTHPQTPAVAASPCVPTSGEFCPHGKLKWSRCDSCNPPLVINNSFTPTGNNPGESI